MVGRTALAGDDYSVQDEVTLTIPAGEMSVTGPLSLTLVNDDLHEGTEELAVRGANADPGLPVTSVRVSIDDDDDAPTSIVLSLDQDRLGEDANPQFLRVTATLEGGGRRTVETTVTLTARDVTTSDSDYFIFLNDVRIGPGQLDGASSLLLIPTNDSIDEEDEILEVSGVATEANLPVSARQVSITDDDEAGVMVSPTELPIREGESGFYTVVLESEPTAPVTVTISGHSGTDVSLDKISLSFTAADWNQEQTVMVTGGQDEDAAGRRRRDPGPPGEQHGHHLRLGDCGQRDGVDHRRRRPNRIGELRAVQLHS